MRAPLDSELIELIGPEYSNFALRCDVRDESLMRELRPEDYFLPLEEHADA